MIRCSIQKQKFDSLFVKSLKLANHKQASCFGKFQRPFHSTFLDTFQNLQLLFVSMDSIHNQDAQMNFDNQPQRPLSFQELLTISNTITAKGHCTGTRKQYSGHVQAYQYWYHSKAVSYPILPLNADAVRAFGSLIFVWRNLTSSGNPIARGWLLFVHGQEIPIEIGL